MVKKKNVAQSYLRDLCYINTSHIYISSITFIHKILCQVLGEFLGLKGLFEFLSKYV